MSECGDCLYYVPNGGDEYCNKSKRSVDSEDPPCSSFLSDSHNCCYDCDAFRVSNNFCSACFKVIKNPVSYYCDRFRY